MTSVSSMTVRGFINRTRLDTTVSLNGQITRNLTVLFILKGSPHAYLKGISSF